ncbi:hypothetical protein ACFL96_12700 [Thermoproteota archaeon]
MDPLDNKYNHTRHQMLKEMIYDKKAELEELILREKEEELKRCP